MDFQKLEQELFPFSKIIEVRQDGQLHLIPENLNAINSYWHCYSSAPARILAVIGGNKSGKTFLTNLLIQSLLNSSSAEKQEELRGFSWDSTSIKISSLVRCDDGDEAGGGGIYLWPIPFLSTGIESGGAVEQNILWILHVDAGSNVANELDFRPIEQFLLLVCSHLVEILYSANKFRLVSSTDTFLKEEVGIEQLCQSVTYLVRAPEGSPLYTHFKTLSLDEETTRKVLGNLFEKSEFSKTPENRVKFKTESTNHFQNATILKFPNYPGSIYGRDGFVCPDPIKILQPYLVNIFSEVTSRVANTPPKMVIAGELFQPLTGEIMTQFFIRAVKIINCINSVQMEVVNEEDEEKLNEVKPQQYLNENHPLTENKMKFCDVSMTKNEEELKPFLSLLETLILRKIESSLTFSNVSSLFQDCFQEALIMPHADAPIPQDLMENYRLEIEKLSSIAKGFTATIRRYFTNNYVCFLNNKDLEKFCQQECSDFLKAFDATATHSNSLSLEVLGTKTCEKLGKIFHKENAEIVSNELKMGDKVVSKVTEFYVSEMTRFWSDKRDNILNYTAEEQEDHHRKLEKECISLFRECMNFNGKRNEILPMKEKELRNYLICSFQEHSKFIQEEQFKAKQALNELQIQNKASYSQTVSRGLPSSSKGMQVVLGPIKVHPQNQFMDATLIFQLTLDDLTMGFILNQDGDLGNPNIIATDLTLAAETEQHKFLFGSDVYTVPGARLWSLRNILGNDGHTNQHHKNQKASENCGNATSYLVGMLLGKLRGKAEAQLGRNFSQAVVTLPCHMKRSCADLSKNILKGAKTYVEFEKVEIVEETECLVFAFLNSVDKSQCRDRGLLVLSQNSQFVDILLYHFDGELNGTKVGREIVDKTEKSRFEKLLGSRVTIEKCLKNIHKQDNLIAAAVVGSGSVSPDIYVGKLLNYFSTVYFFEDSKLAVIIGAIFAVANGKNSYARGVNTDDVVEQKLPTKVLNVTVNQVSTSFIKDKQASSSVTFTSEQKKEKVESSQELEKGKQLLVEVCNEIESRIKKVQFQSGLAKNVLLKKVMEGRKLALECGSSDNNDVLKVVKMQIETLQELGKRNKLFGKE